MSSNTGQHVDLALTLGTWEDTDAMVGASLSPYQGADPVNRADVRRRLEVLEWDCPLHYDEQFARELGHPSAPSPVTLLMTWALPPYWRPGDVQAESTGSAMLPPYSHLEIPAPGTGIFGTNINTTYYADLYEGDTVSARPRFKSMTRKATAVGDGAFLVIETEYVNQRGDLIAVEEFTIYRYEPKTDA